MSASAPTVSILIDTYNSAPWLRACVDSALAQTRPADEVIVYDDGSTDDSVAILRSYGERIRLIEGVHDYSKPGMENQGAAIYRAFLASSGEHVYLLDGDDCYLADHVERYERLWRQAPRHVMIHGSMRMIDQHGTFIRSLYRSDRDQADYRLATYRNHDADSFYPTSALAFRRDFLVRHLPYDFTQDPGVLVDARLCLPALFEGSIGFVPADTACFRFRPGSLSGVVGLHSATRLDESLTRIRQFNTYARRHGHPQISPWRNRNVWQQVARRILPEWIAAPFARRKLERYRQMNTPPPAP